MALRAVLAIAIGLAAVPSAAQVQPAPDDGPGIGALLPHAPVSSAEAAKTADARTDVANAKLPTYSQAVHEATPAKPGAGPVKPPAATGAAASAPPTPAKPH